MRRFNRHVLRLSCLFSAALCAAGPAAGQGDQPDRPPNVVIIFTDDQGYADVGCFGAEGFETPNLDRLAAEGARFTDFYVAQPVCSASRAALLTGCYPNRIGIAGALGPNARHGLNPEETTLAELCKSKGYATAMYGKWHLGHREPFLPVNHGFDEYVGTPYSNDMWPLHPEIVNLPDNLSSRKRRYPDLPLIAGTQVVDAKITPADQKQFTTDFTELAVDFINRHSDQPFFLYIAHPMPHVPLFVSEKFDGATEHGIYGDVIREIDWSTGQIMEALERHGLTDDTLIIFTSDNGPWLSYGDHAGSATPLREGKGTTFEGGVRVPCIMRWPGRIEPGAVRDTPVMTIDILPTVAEIIAADLPDRRIDGRSVLPVIVGEPGAENPHEAYFFYYHGNNLEAIRSGRWKLHLPHTYRSMKGRTPGTPGTGGQPGDYRYGVEIGLSLYDLSTDIGETTNVADDHPDVVARLLDLAEKMRADLGDNLTDTKPTNRREPGRVE